MTKLETAFTEALIKQLILAEQETGIPEVRLR